MDQWQELLVRGFAVGAAWRSRPVHALVQMRSCDTKHVGGCLHREASFGGDTSRKLGFFACALARASFRISTSRVLRPRRRSNSRIRSSSRRTSELPNHRFIRTHRCRASLRHQAPPSVEKVRRHPMPPCHRGDRLPGLAAHLNDPKLLFRRPAPSSRCAGNQFDPLIVVDAELNSFEGIDPIGPNLRRLRRVDAKRVEGSD